MKVCLIRLDKIGDLVCTLPVDEVPWLDGHQIRWVIQQGMGFVASNSVPGRRFLQLNKNSAWESFLSLRRYLREEKFQVAVSFQAPWWVSLALWLERVPLRAGVRSQWHSFLFFNRGLRQRRSQALKHESDYNLDLLAHALNRKVEDLPLQAASEVITCSPQAETLEAVVADRSPLLTRAPHLRMRAPEHPDLWDRLPFQKRKFVLVHPGMAGSALNWPQKNYVTLIRELAKEFDVVVTGTPADQAYLQEIESVKGQARVHWMVGELTATELLNVLHESLLVIAPSTGVAHLGAALGVPVLCFFSPKPVQRPQRWSPRGRHITCLQPQEDSDSCMEEISMEAALLEVRRILS